MLSRNEPFHDLPIPSNQHTYTCTYTHMCIVHIHTTVIKKRSWTWEGEVGHSRSWGRRGGGNAAAEFMNDVLKTFLFRNADIKNMLEVIFF